MKAAAVPAPEFPTLPLVLKRDELALKIWNERAGIKHSLGDGKPFKGQTLQEQEKSLGEIAQKLSEARIVIWRKDLLDAALYHADQFKQTKFPLSYMPTTPQWWPGSVLMQSHHMRTHVDACRREMDHLRNWRLTGALLYSFMGTIGVGLIAVVIFDDKNKKLAQSMTYQTVGTDIPSTGDLPLLIAGLSFMAQEFVGHQTIRLPARFNGFHQQYTPCINQVILRARRLEVVPGSQADSPSQKEWSHCWAVRAHARRLAQPRKSDGQQVIWINPHVKGDTTKPMLPPRDTIVKVIR